MAKDLCGKLIFGVAVRALGEVGLSRRLALVESEVVKNKQQRTCTRTIFSYG